MQVVLHQSILSFFDFQHCFQFVNHDIGEAVAHSVKSNRSLDDLVEGIGSSTVAGIIHCDISLTKHISSKHPVTSIVDVQDHDIILFQVAGDGRPAYETNKFDSKWVDRCPHEKVLTDVTSVSIQPSIEGRRVVIIANATQRHCCRTHQTSSRADCVRRCTQLFTSPLAVALLVQRILP